MGTERHHLVITVRFDCFSGGISPGTSLATVSYRNIAQLKSALIRRSIVLSTEARNSKKGITCSLVPGHGIASGLGKKGIIEVSIIGLKI